MALSEEATIGDVNQLLRGSFGVGIPNTLVDRLDLSAFSYQVKQTSQKHRKMLTIVGWDRQQYGSPICDAVSWIQCIQETGRYQIRQVTKALVISGTDRTSHRQMSLLYSLDSPYELFYLAASDRFPWEEPGVAHPNSLIETCTTGMMCRTDGHTRFIICQNRTWDIGRGVVSFFAPGMEKLGYRLNLEDTTVNLSWEPNDPWIDQSWTLTIPRYLM